MTEREKAAIGYLYDANYDIPDGVVAVGNPCKVLRKITEADKDKYPAYKG